MPPPSEKPVSSAARVLSAFEAEQLGAIAAALSPGYVVVVTSPHGQIEIHPTDSALPLGTVFVADGLGRVIVRWTRAPRRWPDIRLRHLEALRDGPVGAPEPIGGLPDGAA